MTEEQVRAMLLKQAGRVPTRRNSTGVTAWCRKHGVTTGHVSEFLAGKRGPSTDLLDALGLERSYSHKRKPADV